MAKPNGSTQTKPTSPQAPAAATPSVPSKAPTASSATPSASAAPSKGNAPTQAQGEQDKKIPYEQISRRAYEIFQARGGQEGRHVDDWLQAERELKLGRQ